MQEYNLEDVKNNLLSNIPKDQHSHVHFEEDEDSISLLFISKRQKLMCSVYYKNINKMSTFPMA